MSNELKLKRYEYLWDGSKPEWVLWWLNANMSKKEIPRFLIYNEADQSAMIIDDDTIAEKVIRQMRRAGVRIITSCPDEGARVKP